ncbi:phosphatidylglycerophosphatase A [Kroppenstedtia eburnea]|uniref:Phosphatidylglycerophosphatase A n=1 Tax=Kroppenstedtia eburnea TaxID=714067 RepID=A0A1N7LHQ5_9BACL|nr:phosphatidylglycerophosphatase A [Kroppenstedtia eburnea]EGK07734.1 phosphatidylglycerophosphatase [Desmospora sp. 8437]SIS73323.1 Phosphatidylglycerophosphatase A [Kroppenstedtia eburnea]
MGSDMTPVTENEIHQATLSRLNERGVELDRIAELVFYLQKDFHEHLTLEECRHHVEQVLTKREVQNAILTGIQLDQLAEKELLEEPLLDMLRRDESLYGIDEILATSILNVYGSIGMTNYGYVDRMKPGILKDLNDHTDGLIHTFLDDLVGAVAASAAARLTHHRKRQSEQDRKAP